MDGSWIVTQTHNGKVAHHEAPSRKAALSLSDHLQGKVEITYQGAIWTPKTRKTP